MKLKYLNLLIILFFAYITPVNSQSNETERVFNEAFGLDNSLILDSIISKAEIILEKVYDVKEFEKAANKFLSDLVHSDGKVFQNNLNKEDLKEIDSLICQDSLKYKVWDIRNSDNLDYFDFKVDGIYLNAFRNLKDIDGIASKYYEAHNIAGAVSYELLVNGVLKEEKDNFNNFLMKRIIVVDFFCTYALSLLR